MVWPIADAHTDFLMNLRLHDAAMDATVETQRHISLESLHKGNVRLQVFAAFVGDPDLGNPMLQAIEQIQWYRHMINAWNGKLAPVTYKEELCIEEQDNVIRSVLSIEGGEAALGSNLALETFGQLGVRILTLLWNHENEMGYSAVDTATDGFGLKPFGKECIDLLGQQGIAIDVSHLNKAGFWDVIKLSGRPVMASHSNARELCDHPRNLDNDQIKAIIETKGFIGLNFYPVFLTSGSPCTADDIVRHAVHILELGGEDVLGFGSDFEGIATTPQGINGAQDYPVLTEAFEKAGIEKELLEKIFYKNLFRYLCETMPFSDK